MMMKYYLALSIEKSTRKRRWEENSTYSESSEIIATSRSFRTAESVRLCFFFRFLASFLSLSSWRDLFFDDFFLFGLQRLLLLTKACTSSSPDELSESSKSSIAENNRRGECYRWSKHCDSSNLRITNLPSSRGFQSDLSWKSLGHLRPTWLPQVHLHVEADEKCLKLRTVNTTHGFGYLLYNGYHTQQHKLRIWITSFQNVQNTLQTVHSVLFCQ